MAERTKLTSIRLDNEVSEKIDQFLKVHRYWKRSSVINCILKTVFEKFTPNEVYDIVRTGLYKGYPVDCHYEIKNEK